MSGRKHQKRVGRAKRAGWVGLIPLGWLARLGDIGVGETQEKK